MAYKKDPRFLNQVQYCEQQAVPLMVVVGEEEMKNGGVKVRSVKTKEEVNQYSCVGYTQPICSFFSCRCLSSWMSLWPS